jgi:hypothetical protein
MKALRGTGILNNLGTGLGAPNYVHSVSHKCTRIGWESQKAAGQTRGPAEARLCGQRARDSVQPNYFAAAPNGEHALE